jgi:hypothetical protein
MQLGLFSHRKRWLPGPPLFLLFHHLSNIPLSVTTTTIKQINTPSNPKAAIHSSIRPSLGAIHLVQQPASAKTPQKFGS